MTLSERITQLEAALADAHARVSEYERAREIVPEQLRGRAQRLEADVGWLRELQARRIAMGREVDDELNAPADVCCCGPNLQRWRGLRELGCCPVHPRPVLSHDVPND